MQNDTLYPLSDYQLGLFMDFQLDPNSTACNLPYLFTLPAGCDLDRLAQAIERVFGAHPALLTRFVKHDNQFAQWVKGDDRVDVQRISLSADQLEPFVEQFVRPFEPFDQPLYRMVIVQTPSENYLLFDFFHLIFDGGSMVQFMSELDRAYCGDVLDQERVSVLDHALEQTQERGGAQWIDDQAFYDSMLDGVEPIDFAGDSPTEARRSATQRVDFVLPKSETGDLRAQGITPNQLFHAATAIVLSRVCRTEKVTHVTLHHGRLDQDRKHNLGYYVRTLPVVIDVKRELTVRQFLDSVRGVQKQIYDHVNYPFTEIYKKHALAPDFYYSYQGLVNEEYLLAGEQLVVRPLPIDQHGISVRVYDKANQYNLRVTYDKELYSQELACALGQGVLACVLDMLADLDKPVSRVQLVGDPSELLTLSQGERVAYDEQQSFVDLLLEQVKRNPNHVAVADGSSTISYAELDKNSDSLAAVLREAGVGQGVFVGVMMPRVKEYLTAVVGVWKAGGAYLPLDSEYPLDRLQYMVEDSQAKVLITTSEMECGLNVERKILLDQQPLAPVQPTNEAKPEGLAYMIYTSGSTGKPKGVMIAHHSLTAFLHAMNHLYGLSAQDKICCHSSFSFDASVEDLYPVLTVGGELHILSPALRFDMRALNDYITKKGITGGCYTTQFGVEFISQFNPRVRYLTVGGEKMDRAPVCDTVIYNTYGPTEFTVDATIFTVENGKPYRNIPIGRPMPNARAYVMDLYGNLMPRAFAGELCMAGAQTAMGYWQRGELTEEKFLPDPYAPTEKLYRTGDLVKWNDHDQLEYLGRIDNQVKLRGFRIELGEIESQMGHYSGILSSCVEVRKIGTVEHLCAYYTASEPIDSQAMKRQLANTLTEYMVPTVYTQLERMPLTPNGKVNRRALPEPILEREELYVAPQNELERQICELFQAELKLQQVGIDDNFFEIGGSSLLAISALIRIENQGHKLAYGDLFKCKTPRAIAQFLSESHTDADQAEEYPIGEYDYRAIDQLLTSQRQDWFGDFATVPLGNVLLTGSTGYLGAHLLFDLIQHTDSKIYCLLRAKKEVSVAMRLKAISMYYFGQTFEELYGQRIFTIEGDITDQDLQTKINPPIDTVINSAALVKHYEAGNQMELINHHAVENLADYCLATGARLVHVSTYSTAGVSIDHSVASGHLFNERELYIGQSHVLKYTWTKFLAERAILERVATRGLRAKIMRVGNLMGRASDGEFQINFHANAFVNSLRAYKVLGVFPLNRMVERSEESPIDAVARAIVLLSSTPDDVVVLQPYNCYEHDMGTIIKAMQRSGYPIDVVSNEAFLARFDALMADPDKSRFLSGILHSSASKTVRYIGANCDTTTTILYRLGFHWPQSDGSYIERLLGALEGMGFFDEQ